MSKLREQLAEVQEKIDLVQSVPEDRFHLGTVVLFSPEHGEQWYIKKVAEESWVKLSKMGRIDSVEHELCEWILAAIDGANMGPFELYELKVQPVPFYSHS